VTNFGSKPAKKVSSKTLQAPEPRYSQSGELIFINVIMVLSGFWVDGHSLARCLLQSG
jgi:hypothetical protein